jgi:hypothetical protein
VVVLFGGVPDGHHGDLERGDQRDEDADPEDQPE